ncbi:hypothetical protein F2Q69_00048653 [Brassica cretica]|uniref:Uncharacterized protein n=1 Tax=Brassica cretica TaxID=69181 RepID=A0A8S9PV54_BRACR|nr:hypothetical protein F2Q69_00048653 [Brassica cretica]
MGTAKSNLCSAHAYSLLPHRREALKKLLPFCYKPLALVSRLSPLSTHLRMKRSTAEEKGKGVVVKATEQPHIHIRTPDFDPSGRIKENLLTLGGRLTNSKEQKVSYVLPFLPK